MQILLHILVIRLISASFAALVRFVINNHQPISVYQRSSVVSKLETLSSLDFKIFGLLHGPVANRVEHFVEADAFEVGDVSGGEAGRSRLFQRQPEPQVDYPPARRIG